MSPPRLKPTRQRYAGLAIDALRQALADGFQDVKKLEQDGAFDAIRTRADFKALLPAGRRNDKGVPAENKPGYMR